MPLLAAVTAVKGKGPWGGGLERGAPLGGPSPRLHPTGRGWLPLMEGPACSVLVATLAVGLAWMRRLEMQLSNVRVAQKMQGQQEP